MRDRIDSAYGYLKDICHAKPVLGVVLGSGLGGFADGIKNAVHINYSDIPGFPVSTVTGHKGNIVFAEIHGKMCLIFQGRFHGYEGYSPDEAAIHVRVMKKLGVENLLLTAAVGGINYSYDVGDIMLITDHINFSGKNPLTGKNLDEFGPRFPGMSEAYSKELSDKLLKAAKNCGQNLVKGVYCMFNGPSYETPAEIRMARILGADAAGMSVVFENIAAVHSGIKTAGIAVITNMAAGMSGKQLNHEEVLREGKLSADKVSILLDNFIKIL